MPELYELIMCVPCYMRAVGGYSDHELGEPDATDLKDWEEWLATLDRPLMDGKGEQYFGKLPCDRCGERLHGDRMDVTMTTA